MSQLRFYHLRLLKDVPFCPEINVCNLCEYTIIPPLLPFLLSFENLLMYL